jgi:CubicO group peptidase (beta-lactamase class C family)
MYRTPKYLLKMQEPLVKLDTSSSSSIKIDMHIDSVGAAWIIDKHNDIIWHNGGTGHFNSYLGFDQSKKIAVVVLSNLAPNYRISATIMGVKLLTDLQN